MVDDLKIRLTIPRQDLTEFSLFPLTAEGARSWANSLPVVNTQVAAQHLAQALNDLNRTRLSPEARYDILEILRPNLAVALTSLSKRYLKQPLVMPEEPDRMVVLTKDLLASASTAYTVIAVETIRGRDTIKDANPARLACEAIHRALGYTGGRVLQSFQLYRPLPIQSWLGLHQLYALAEAQQLEQLPVKDPGFGGKTIKSTYLQTLILSCCKPNQLRQSDLASMHRALADWSDLVELQDIKTGTGLFLVDLYSDQPPLYTALWPEPYGPGFRYINARRLVDLLADLKNRAAEPEDESVGGAELPAHLRDHLRKSLERMSLRNFKRTPSSSLLRVCMGLSSVHYHIAGRTDFESIVGEDPEAAALIEAPKFRSPDKADRADIWQQAHPETDYVRNEWLPGAQDSENVQRQVELDDATRAELLEEVEVQLPLDQRYPIFKVQLTDASPGGYCLQWSDNPAIEVHTGDIVSLKEEAAEYWVIAVVRWLSRLQSSRTLIGLELLSPEAKAYAARFQGPDGVLSAPQRVLLLPEIKLVGQPDTLITSRTGFREHQRVTLINHEEKHRIELLRQISSTASFTQFEFKYVTELGDLLSEEQSKSPASKYDSLWSNI